VRCACTRSSKRACSLTSACRCCEMMATTAAALWRIVPCVYLPSFTATLGDLFTSPILSLVAVDLSQAGAAAAGTVAAASGTAAMLTQLPAAALYGLIGPRATLAAGAAISSVATLCAAACVRARHFGAFVAASALMGCGRALMRMATTAYVRELAPAQLRGRATALSGGIHRFAAIVAPTVGGFVAKRYGMAGPFLLGALSKALGSVLFLCGPKPPPPPQAAAALVVEEKQPSSGGERAGSSWLSILRQERKFFTGACLAICGLTVLRQALTIMVPLLGRELGMPVESIGAAQSAGATVDSVMFLPTGWGYDRLGRKAMVVPALMLMSCGWLVLSLASNARSLLRGTVLIGLGHGLTAGIQSLTVQDFAPPAPQTQTFIGLYMLLTDGVALGGPLVLTRLAQSVSVAVATRVTASLGLVAAGWYWCFVPEVTLLRNGRRST
jgi:MFS family permease